MTQIHPTAIVEKGAELGDGVVVGPYAIVRAEVRIGAGTVVGPFVLIEGRTTIGRENRLASHSALGGPPQDKKYKGEPTELVVGNGNTIREYVTMNVGTVQDQGVTRVGDDNWIMNNVHIAHDCRVGSHTIIAGYAGLAGHVQLDDWAIVGAQSGLLQRIRFGAHAMCGFASHVSLDVPPFMMVDGNPLAVRGFNIEGLRRRGFSAERIGAVKRMHRLLYRSGLPLADAIARTRELAATTPEAAADIALVADFVEQSTRGIAR